MSAKQMDLCKFIARRKLRDIRDSLSYPIWLLCGGHAPDNSVYKCKRIIAIADRYSCDTFLETGTFYGQTLATVRNKFARVLSVELSREFYESNLATFVKYPEVMIYYGDSSVEMNRMLNDAKGRILFWLDGHYSGVGTACGSTISPILSELELIAQVKVKDHCILIDDARLFTGTGGYPKRDQVNAQLLEINPAYKISVDHDCIMALPS